MRMRAGLPLVAALLCGGCGASTSDDDALTVPAPGPATVHSSPGQQVVLHHCGVQPVNYDNRSWEVEDPPFDMGSAPRTFSGFGTFRRDGDVLTFRDRKGARLTFTPDDGTPDPYNCA